MPIAGVYPQTALWMIHRNRLVTEARRMLGTVR
jgi:hypothetical protein